MSLSQGLWLATWMKSMKNTQDAKRRGDNLEETIYQLADVLGSTNDALVSARSERDSYKSLSKEMVQELKGLKPTRLSAPNADKERVEHLKEQFRLSAKEHTAAVEEQYQQTDPRIADRARNNSDRKRMKNSG